jgi:AraC-like DNA-binding protein
MAKALAWLAERWQERPSLDEAAQAVGLSPFHFQRVFSRWAGVSPKTFVAAIAHAEARKSLEAGASVLDAAYDAGLSGPSRLHDLFIAQEAVTPGDVRRRGRGDDLTLGLGADAVRQGPVRHGRAAWRAWPSRTATTRRPSPTCTAASRPPTGAATTRRRAPPPSTPSPAGRGRCRSC